MKTSSVNSPIGILKLSQDCDRLHSLGWDDELYENNTDKMLLNVQNQLSEYFLGKRKEFDIEMILNGTEFQKKVWRAILAVPYGQIVSYNEIAKKLNTGPRAVANACGKNPIPIIVPCHRILPSSGKVGGYSGKGGTHTKKKLLEIEGIYF